MWSHYQSCLSPRDTRGIWQTAAGAHPQDLKKQSNPQLTLSEVTFVKFTASCYSMQTAGGEGGGVQQNTSHPLFKVF